MEKRVNIDSSDTIAAISTYPGIAGIGIIKISGPKSVNLVSKIFAPCKKKNIKKAKTYTLHYGWIVDKSNSSKGSIIDEVLVSLMRRPYSYTTQDVVEIYSHSGPVVLGKILDLVLQKGARQAHPGEFTKRAYLSGRIDLVQAEAIQDIVNAKTDEALKVSMFQLKGGLSKRLTQLKEKIRNIILLLEADISFPEEQIRLNKATIKKYIEKIIGDLNFLLKYSQEAKFLREGAECVICGRTNVGKSSLLNMLLQDERVIVTPVAGTTRDIIEEHINIRGLPLKIYDTAGILEPQDLIEEKALKKSYQKLEHADLVLLIFDGSQKLKKEDLFLINKVKNKKVIFLINKIDLRQKIEVGRLKNYSVPIVRVSALKDMGLAELEDTIIKSIWAGFQSLNKESTLVSNRRHIDLLEQVFSNMRQAHEYLKYEASLDFVLFSLNSGLDKLYEISGKKIGENILDSIFENFCIGK